MGPEHKFKEFFYEEEMSAKSQWAPPFVLSLGRDLLYKIDPWLNCNLNDQCNQKLK
jgi:hypothetical protein